MGFLDSDEKGAVVRELKNNVMYLRINRPEDKNRVNSEGSEILADAYEEVLAHPEIRCVVITGTDGYFHTGGRVNADDPADKARYSSATKRRNKLLSEISVPIISVINGDCFAGGMSLVMQSDLAIAVDTARFAYPEITRGSFPIMAMVTAVDYLPKKQALAAFYMGEPFDAQTALNAGLINCIVSKDKLWSTVDNYVNSILDKPAELIEIGRRAYNRMAELPMGPRREYGMEVLQEIMAAQAKYEKPEDK
jgi:enoyl-CoA hydratase/carnithine racemase